jgi:hypothetical protein
MEKKITKATVKSFINKNFDNLFIKFQSSFDGMTDGIEYSKNSEFSKITKTERNLNHSFGINGAWFVGSSRDYFEAFENDNYKGFYIYNSCGSFYLAIKKVEISV